MDGILNFDTAFPQKLQLLAPTYDDLDKLGQYMLQYIDPERKEMIDTLHSQWHHVGILSQWYIRSSLPIANYLSIPHERVFALDFIHDDKWWFVGLDMTQDLMYSTGKQHMIEQLRQYYPSQKIIFSGDSVGDMRSGRYADLFIGYVWSIRRPAMADYCPNLAQSPYDVLYYIHNFIS